MLRDLFIIVEEALRAGERGMRSWVFWKIEKRKATGASRKAKVCQRPPKGRMNVTALVLACTYPPIYPPVDTSISSLARAALKGSTHRRTAGAAPGEMVPASLRAHRVHPIDDRVEHARGVRKGGSPEWGTSLRTSGSSAHPRHVSPGGVDALGAAVSETDPAHPLVLA